MTVVAVSLVSVAVVTVLVVAVAVVVVVREEAVLYAGSGTVDTGFCNQGSAVRSPLRARRGKKTAPCGKRTGWLSERAVHILSITVFFCASRYDGLQSTSSVHQCA